MIRKVDSFDILPRFHTSMAQSRKSINMKRYLFLTASTKTKTTPIRYLDSDIGFTRQNIEKNSYLTQKSKTIKIIHTKCRFLYFDLQMDDSYLPQSKLVRKDFYKFIFLHQDKKAKIFNMNCLTLKSNKITNNVS